MATMRAVVVDHDVSGKLTVGEVDAPEPGPGEALVRVSAVSLNRGEVRMAQGAGAGHRPGWDLAGVVERKAADGGGPAQGARVVGLLRAGAWAEQVAVPTSFLAALPDEVSDAQAATLPVAGLTALHALRQRGSLLGRTVLVTGASGGVGYYAVQFARLSGARVVAHTRGAEREAEVRAAGAHEVATGEDVAAAGEYGPYDLIVDGVGGATLGAAIPLLAPDGVCVCYGSTAGNDVTFPINAFYGKGRASLYGLTLFNEFVREPASAGLATLARLVADGSLRPLIEVEEPWERVGEVARRLLDREYAGKAVLRVGS